MKLKAETTVKEIDQKLLYFITIDVLNIEQQHPSSMDTITLPMTRIIKSYFNKHSMSLELIHYFLLHPYESIMKLMFFHQMINGLPKHCLNKLNKSPCKICYTAKMTTPPKVTTVDTSNLQPGEIIHMNLKFYNVTTIPGLNSMLTVVFAKNIMIWVFSTAPNQDSVRIIRFILIKFQNEQHPCKRVRVDEGCDLEKSTHVTNLLVYKFKLSMETTVGDVSWLNRKN